MSAVLHRKQLCPEDWARSGTIRAWLGMTRKLKPLHHTSKSLNIATNLTVSITNIVTQSILQHLLAEGPQTLAELFILGLIGFVAELKEK